MSGRCRGRGRVDVRIGIDVRLTAEVPDPRCAQGEHALEPRSHEYQVVPRQQVHSPDPLSGRTRATVISCIAPLLGSS